MNKAQRKRWRFVELAISIGLPIIPLVARGKKPAMTGWKENPFTDVRAAREYFTQNPDANYGIVTGEQSNIVALDIDGEQGRRSLRKFVKEVGKLPNTVRVETPNGQHAYYRYPGGNIRNSVGKLGPGIDVRADGGYVVGPGSIHPSGGVYEYKDGFALGELPIARMPKRLIKKLKATPRAAEHPVSVSVPPALTPRVKAYCERALELELLHIRNAPIHRRNNTLNRSSFRIGQLMPYQQLDLSATRQQLADAAKASGLSSDEAIATIESGMKAGISQPRKLPFSGAPRVERSQKSTENTRSVWDTDTEALSVRWHTDADNAERLVRRFHDRIAWSPGLGWLIYDGRRWVPDEHGKRLTLAVMVAEAIRDEAKHLKGRARQRSRIKHGTRTKNKAPIDRMLELARPHLAVNDDQFDRDPWLLNVANGTIDLKTGCLEKHNPDDLITKLANVNYSSKAKCKKFKRFLRQVTGGNKQFARLLKKAFGYTLTGDTSEQVIFFLWGPTATGKSTLVNLLRDILGDYGKHTPTDVLLVKRFDTAIPVAEARLKGARMVTAIEVNHNQQIDEAKLKGMTGGDKITARFMRQNLFEYQPEFKLWFAVNDLPRVRASDDAIWRRLVVLPFNAQIDKGKIDKNLAALLRKEASGILAWAVRGSLLWAREEGLEEITLFEGTKNAWRKHADSVKAFFQDCCRHSAQTDKVQSSVLFNRYKEWCTAHGEQPCSTDMFKARLLELNLTYKRMKNGSNWLGVKLIE